MSKHKKEDKLEDRQALVDELMNELIDEVSCGLCFEVHRACKLGTIFLDETDNEGTDAVYDLHRQIVSEHGLDVFGQVSSMKKQYECICPSCERSLAASRFAPHLEKCMGMGRISSRIASRRIASNTGRRGSDESDVDDNSSEYSCRSDRRTKRLKKDKSNGASKKSKKFKGVDSPTITSTSDVASQPVFDSLTFDEKTNLLINTCGVISEHTSKMCTRSLKCPQHSDEQRRVVRQYLLGSQSAATNDDTPIDIDSYEDMSTGVLQMSWDTASNSSPSSRSMYGGSSSKKVKSSLQPPLRKNASMPGTFASSSESGPHGGM